MGQFGTTFVKLLFVYAIVVGIAYFLQDSLTYAPDKKQFVPIDWGMDNFEKITVEARDRMQVSSWYHPATAGDAYTVVFFQGNAGGWGLRNFKYKPLYNRGYGLLLVGYRGYSGNPGEPSEEGLYNDARAIIRHLIEEKGVPESSIVLYGESLGTAVAIQMATEFNFRAMILEAPFTDLPSVGAYQYPWLPARLLANEEYNSMSKMGKVNVPLMIIHGEMDKIVPVSMGKELFAAAKEPKESRFLSNAGHNDLYEHGAGGIIGDYLQGLAGIQ